MRTCTSPNTYTERHKIKKVRAGGCERMGGSQTALFQLDAIALTAV